MPVSDQMGGTGVNSGPRPSQRTQARRATPAPSSPAPSALSTVSEPEREEFHGFQPLGVDLLSLLTQPEPFDPTAVPTAREQVAEALARQDRDPMEVRAEAFRGLYDNDPTTGRRTDPGNATRAYEELRRQGEPEQPSPPTLEEAQANLRGALREEREAAIGADRPARPIRKQVDRLTLAEYEALDPRQRAAVDFNTMLVQAVRKDRRLQDTYNPTDQERETYDLAVEKMFGEDRGSDMYAPETLSLLRQIGFSDEKADLDDFLNLRAAIRERDLKNLDLPGAPSGVTGGTQMSDTAFDRVSLARSLANDTQTMQRALANNTELADTIARTAALERRGLVQSVGGRPADGGRLAQVPGYGNSELDDYYRLAFEALMNKRSDRDKLLEVFQTDIANGVRTPEEIAGFWDYADQRTRLADRYDVELGKGKKVRSPEEIRKFFGLDKKEERDGS